MIRHEVELHLDDAVWWAHCDRCRFSAAADTFRELKELVRTGHRRPFDWNLVEDCAAPVASASMPTANPAVTKVVMRVHFG